MVSSVACDVMESIGSPVLSKMTMKDFERLVKNSPVSYLS